MSSEWAKKINRIWGEMKYLLSRVGGGLLAFLTWKCKWELGYTKKGISYCTSSHASDYGTWMFGKKNFLQVKFEFCLFKHPLNISDRFPLLRPSAKALFPTPAAFITYYLFIIQQESWHPFNCPTGLTHKE